MKIFRTMPRIFTRRWFWIACIAACLLISGVMIGLDWLLEAPPPSRSIATDSKLIETTEIDKRPLKEIFAGLPKADASGRVLDETSHTVSGAEVILYYSHGIGGARDRVTARTKTAADGTFEFKQNIFWEPVTWPDYDNPPKYVVIAAHPERGLSFNVIVAGDKTDGLTIRLRGGLDFNRYQIPRTMVLHDEAGRPIAGASVYVAEGWLPNGDLDNAHRRFTLKRPIDIFTTVSDADGRVEPPFTGMGASQYMVEKEGFAATLVRDPSPSGLMELNAAMREPEPQERVFTIPPPPALIADGNVTWPDGSPASDIEVRLIGGYTHVAMLTDAAGHYRFATKPINKDRMFTIHVTDPRPDSCLLPQTVSNISIEPGQKFVRNFQLRRGCIVDGTVIDSQTSRTVPNVLVDFDTQGGAWRAGVDKNGRFRTTCPNGSRFGVRMVSNLCRIGGRDYLIEPTVIQNSVWVQVPVVTQDIHDMQVGVGLVPLAPLKGRVIGAKNGSVQSDIRLPAASIDAEGNFILEAVPAERDFDIVAYSEGPDKKQLAGMTHVPKGSLSAAIQLEPTFDYRLQVRDQNREPVANLYISIMSMLNSRQVNYGRSVVTNARGECTLTGIYPRLQWKATWSNAWQGGENIEPGNAMLDLPQTPGEPVQIRITQYIGTLSGRIVSGLDGRPVAGVPVSVKDGRAQRYNGRGAATDSDGRFSINGLQRGTVELSVTAEEFENFKGSFSTDQKNLAIQLAPLRPWPRDYVFSVTDSSGRPVAGASLEFSYINPKTYRKDKKFSKPVSLKTNQNGVATMAWSPPAGVSPRNVTGLLKCDVSGYNLCFRGIKMFSDFQVSMRLHKESEPYHGLVVDQKKKPVSGAKITLVSFATPDVDPFKGGVFAHLGENSPYQYVTNWGGDFEIPRFGMPDYVGGRVQAEGYADTYVSFGAAGPLLRFDISATTITLQRAGTIKGRVIVEHGSLPMDNVQVGVRSGGGGAVQNYSLLKSDGSFEIRGLAPGLYTPWCSNLDQEGKSAIVWFRENSAAAVKVVAEQSADMTVKVEAAYRVFGRVENQTSGTNRASQTRVICSGSERHFGEIWPKADGTFEVFMPEGEYQLQSNSNKVSPQKIKVTPNNPNPITITITNP